MYLIIQDVLGRDRKEFSVNKPEDLEPIFKLFPFTRNIETDNFRDLVDMIAEVISNHYLNAKVIDDNIAEKFKGYIVENKDNVVAVYDPNMIIPIIDPQGGVEKEVFKDHIMNWHKERTTPKLSKPESRHDSVKEPELKPITDRDKIREAIDNAQKNKKS